MSQAEKLWSNEAAGLEIRLARESSPAVIGLLKRTVWGSRKMRYRIRDVEAKLGRLGGPHYLTLESSGDLAAVCVLNRRMTRLLGAPVDSFHFAMIATEPAFAGNGFASLLAEQAGSLCRDRLSVPGIGYAYIESTTEYSIRISSRLGSAFEAMLPLMVFNRFWPSDDHRVGLLSDSEVKGVVQRLSALYQGHVLDDFEDSVIPGEFYVLRECGEVVAGAQAEVLNWSVELLPGGFGWLIVKLLPRLPLLRHLLDAADLRFLRFGNILVDPGREAHLFQLMNAMLARHKVPLGLVMLDARSPVYRRIRAHGRLGLLNQAVGGSAKAVADFKGVSDAAIARIRARPMLMSPLDVF